MGYTVDDLENILGDRFDEFTKWMYGQTMSVCEGRLYNHDKKTYEPAVCADNPHGGVVYPWDLKTFLQGRPSFD